MNIPAETVVARLETGKGYTAARLIERLTLRIFQDLVANGRLVWFKDDTFGNKLYRKTN